MSQRLDAERAQPADEIKAEGVRFLERRAPYNKGTVAQAFEAFLETLERFNESQTEACATIYGSKPSK